MKKLLLIGSFLVTAVGAFAQGTVNFANNSSSFIVNGATGQNVTSAQGFKAALYWAVDGTSDFNSFTQIGAISSGFVGAVPPGTGLISAGTRTTGNATAPGAFAMFQIRVWDSNAGAITSYESGVAAGRAAGFSNMVRVQTGDGGALAAGSLTANGLQGFTVAPVPEPSTIALGALGLGSLFFIRRRK